MSDPISQTAAEHYLKTALRELADATEIAENSTDSGHWDRLYRAIAQARRLLDD